ncbi:MAG TPA: DegT/DnrJ/EryC1/StrS family aminotransferase, partial [Spirochaetales bacterium]|nr:DegT/DnrJ/EryC1/StrS family aminotransferase [Spirochaetales bacterium]
RGGLARDEFIESLAERGVGTSVHFIPLHTMPYYAGRYGLEPGSMPNAMAMFERTVSLPIWQGMGLDAARRVADAVLAVAEALHA